MRSVLNFVKSMFWTTVRIVVWSTILFLSLSVASWFTMLAWNSFLPDLLGKEVPQITTWQAFQVNLLLGCAAAMPAILAVIILGLIVLLLPVKAPQSEVNQVTVNRNHRGPSHSGEYVPDPDLWRDV